MAIVRQLVILYFSDYRIAGVVPCTENVPEDEITKHSHAWIYNGHFNESETGQIGNLGFSLDPYIKCKCMHILKIPCLPIFSHFVVGGKAIQDDKFLKRQ